MKKPTREQIEAAKSILIKAGYIAPANWHIDDILYRGKELDIKLTKKHARKIATDIERTHDATIGINWDVIDFHITE